MLSNRNHEFNESLLASELDREQASADLGTLAVPSYLSIRSDGLGGAVAGERIEDMAEPVNPHNDIPLPRLPHAKDDKPPPSDEVSKQAAKDKAAEQAKLAKKAVKDFKKGGGNG